MAAWKRCVLRGHWTLECDHTHSGDPWCIIYDQQHHRIVLHIARIERVAIMALATCVAFRFARLETVRGGHRRAG